jgi:hypothetical protein
MSRRIENRIEVPGTPEQVWEAIATGPGIEAWFVPADVEPREGGRVALDMLVSTLHADGEGWDDVLESMHQGWSTYLLNLRAHLTHFPGQRCATIMVSGRAPGPPARAWPELTGALGLADATEGETVAATGAPSLEGIVEYRGEGDLLLRLTAPAAGIALVYVYPWQETVRTNVHLYLFEASAQVAAREAPRWREWMAEVATAA